MASGVTSLAGGAHLPHGVHQLGVAAVVERHGEHHAGVAARCRRSPCGSPAARTSGCAASGLSNGRPIHWIRTFSSLSSATRPNSFSCRPRMWRTSARGRTQFSVENPNTVSQPTLRVHGDAHEAGQVLLALGVAGGAGQAPLARPSGRCRP